MADIPSVSETLGLPAEVVHGGVTYKIGPPNQLAKAYLEKAFAASVLRAVTELQEVLPHKEYRQLYDSVLSKIASKHYATGSVGWFEQLQNVEGMTTFIYSLFRANHADITLDKVREIVQSDSDSLNAALVEVVPAFFDFAIPNPPPELKASLAEMKAKLIDKYKKDRTLRT